MVQQMQRKVYIYNYYDRDILLMTIHHSPYFMIVQQIKFIDANYCIVKFSVVREVGSIIKVLKAFPVSSTDL